MREFVCDDVVTQEPGSTVNYLRTLVRMVEQKSESCREQGTLSIGRANSELGIRPRRLTTGFNQDCLAPGRWSIVPMFIFSIACSQFWLPTNPLISETEVWSPWPTWTATTLHAFDLSVRDYEKPETRDLVQDWREGPEHDD